MRKILLLQQIESLQARVKHLEECIKTQDLLLEGYQNREFAVVAAMQRVQNDVEQRIAAANEKAQQIEQSAKQKSAQLLAQTEATVAEYRDAIERYNCALEIAAAEAAENAERFARFARKRKLSEDAIVRESVGLSDLPYQEHVTLPDPEGDPAQLMHNIYRLQNRVIPAESQQEPAAESDVQPEPEPASKAELAPAQVEEMIDSFMEDDASLHTVSAVLEELGTTTEMTQEISLDDLLDEIINSGEQYHG